MPTSSPPSAGELISCAATPAFVDWMKNAGGSLALTTYQAGKIALIGWTGSEVSLFLRDFDRPMGLAFDGMSLALATRQEILLFANASSVAPHFPMDQPKGYDALFLPRTIYLTGGLGVHDVAIGGPGEVLFANTLFSCLSSCSRRNSFETVWWPSFVSEMVPEDRCHLNGLAMRDGAPAFVTALGSTDVREGWRVNRHNGGVLVDVGSRETLLSDLSMPHSPRLHNGRLWFLNSGRGELCVSDPPHTNYQVVCALPGFLRGLSFAGDWAIVGLCKIREKHLFAELPVRAMFPRLVCGVGIVDLRSGSHVASLEFTGGCHEVYDVQFLGEIRKATICNPRDENARRTIITSEFSYLHAARE